MTPEALVQALHSRAWYALAGVALFFLLDGWKRIAPIWSPRIPDGWRWLPPVLIGAATGFVDAYRSGLVWYLGLAMAVYGALSVGGTAMGVQGALKESVLTGLGAWGGPGGAALLAFCLLGLPSMTGCASLKPIARTVDDVAHSLCALHYSEREGMSLEDAGKRFCETEAMIRPWLDLALRAQRDGASAPAQCVPPPKTP